MPVTYIGGPAGHQSLYQPIPALGYSTQHGQYSQAVREQRAMAYASSDQLISVAYLVGYPEKVRSSAKSHMPKFASLVCLFLISFELEYQELIHN